MWILNAPATACITATSSAADELTPLPGGTRDESRMFAPEVKLHIFFTHEHEEHAGDIRSPTVPLVKIRSRRFVFDRGRR